jgi:hypothetical protein
MDDQDNTKKKFKAYRPNIEPEKFKNKWSKIVASRQEDV